MGDKRYFFRLGQRFLNYRHPKGRCIQIADEPSINLVFNRLYVDGKGVPFKYVPEPPPDSYEGKRPEARLYAPSLGISTAFEFAPNPAGSNGHRLHGIQTLLYPADLERQLRKIASEAKTAVEETGTNMLFLGNCPGIDVIGNGGQPGHRSVFLEVERWKRNRLIWGGPGSVRGGTRWSGVS